MSTPTAQPEGSATRPTAAGRGAFAAVHPGAAPSHDFIDTEHPWLGLASFTEETRSYFHGRDDEVAELCRRVQRKLLTVLFGQSGLGKTSILRAGVVPRLRAEGYCPVYVRLDYGREAPPPSEQIKQAVIRATTDAGTWTRPGVATAGESLWEFLHHRDDHLISGADVAARGSHPTELSSARTLTPLLIFDQFEEIFTLAQGDDFGRQRAAEFKQDLADLVENRAPKALEARLERDEAAAEPFDFARADYRILIALREDYLAHLEGLKADMPSVTQNRMRLARMTGTQALTAVTGPGGRLVSEEVARSIVRFVAGGAELDRAEVEPSLLSLVCRELNNTRLARGHAEISADLLAGSRETILSEFYERALTDQPPGVRIFVEDELLTDSGYRESIAEERVRKAFIAAGATPEALATLIDRRLLRVEERLDVRRVELTHDVLCGVVKTSRDVRHEREGKAAIERQLAATRERETAAKRALWRSRRIALGSGILAIAAVASAVVAFANLRRARESEARAQIAARDATAAEVQTRNAEAMAARARGQAEELLTFVIDDLWENLEPLGRLDLVRELSTRVVGYYEGLPDSLRNADARRGLAMTLAQRGIIIGLQGDLPASDADLQRAFALLAELKKTDPDNVAIWAAESLAHYGRARLLYQRSLLHDAAVACEQATSLARKVAAAPNATRANRLLLPTMLGKFAFFVMRDNRETESAALFAEALAGYRALGAPTDDDVILTARYAEDCVWASENQTALGHLDVTEQLAEESRTVAERVLAKSPGDLRARRTLALAAGRLRSVAGRRLQLARALEFAQLSRRQYEALLTTDPTNSVTVNNLAVARSDEGEVLLRLGRRTEGERMLEQAARIDTRVKLTNARAWVVSGYNYDLAEWYTTAGEATKAATVLTEAARLRKIGEANLSTDSNTDILDRQRGEFVARLVANADLDDAAVIASANKSLQAVAALQPKNEGDKQGLIDTRYAAHAHLAEAYARLSRWAEAETAARAAMADGFNAERYGIPAQMDEAHVRLLLGLALVRQGRPQDVAALLIEPLAFVRKVHAGQPNDLATQFAATFALLVAVEAETDANQRAALLAEAQQAFAPTAAYPKAPARKWLGPWLAQLASSVR